MKLGSERAGEQMNEQVAPSKFGSRRVIGGKNKNVRVLYDGTEMTVTSRVSEYSQSSLQI